MTVKRCSSPSIPWTLEAALPDMPTGRSPAMNTPGMGDRQRLQDAADRLPALRRQHQVKVVGHQAIGVEIERVAFASFPQRVEKGAKVGIAAKDHLTVVAAIDRVVTKPWSMSRGRRACQRFKQTQLEKQVKKRTDTNYSVASTVC